MSGYGRGMSGRVVWDMATESKERERKEREEDKVCECKIIT
jgi:hypothetical protein